MSLSGFTRPWSQATRMAVLAGAALWLVLLCVLGIALERERRQSIAQAMDEAGTLAAVLEESTARTFGSVDIALQGIASYFATRDVPRHDAGARQVMREMLPLLPTVRALFVIGPDGWILHDTDYPKTPNVSLADRPYFRQYLEQPQLQHALSSALQSRSGTGWFVASTRRISAPDGRFLGIVVAAVQLDWVSRLYRKLELGEGQRLALLQADGHLMAAYPDGVVEVGRSYADLPLFTQHLPRARSGAYISNAPPLGYTRVVGYRRVENQPLVVTIATREDSVLAAWRRAAGGAALGLLLAGVLLALGVVFFVQRQEHLRQAQLHRAAEEKARQFAQEMVDADRVKTEFLATLSHELRNVLAPMNNGMLILEMPQSSGAQQERARDIVKRHLAQMRRLVDDLLDISRVSSGKVHLEREPIDLREVLAAAAEAAQPLMEAPRHRFEASWPDEPLPVSIDRVRIHQVLANLLGNAAKYTPPGGHIRLAASRTAHEAVVTVQDNGVGIPPEALGKVFGMFQQVSGHEARSQGGLGIGLALVQKLVALHGGHVEVDSAGVNRGCTFTIRLPLAADQSAPNSSVSTSARDCAL